MALPDFDRHINYADYYGQYVRKAKLNGDQLVGLCPMHPEKNASFSANIKTGQWICRSNCGSGNVIDFHAKMHNMSHEEAIADLKKKYCPPEGFPPSKRIGLPAETLDQLSEIPAEGLKYLTEKRGWSPEIIQKYGIKYHDKQRRKAFALPVYTDGALVNIRTYAPGTQNKIMSWGKGLGEARLYPESVLKDAREAGQPVFLCEGEPDALCGLSRDLRCVTQTAGAETWKDHFNAKFKGLDVIICYDNDEAGRKGAERVAQHLPHFAKSVSTLQWPDWMGEKEDLTDWFVKYGKTVEELLALPRVECLPTKKETKQDQELERRLAELNLEYAVVMVSGKCLIMKQCEDPVFNRRDIQFSSFHDFRNFLGNEKHWVENGNGKLKKHSIAEIWIDQSERTQYRGIVFNPQSDIPDYFNLWRGFAIKPQKGECGRLIDHIFQNIAQRNSRIFQYVMAWMAEIVQRPGGPRPGISLVLRGKQGVGKGCLAEYFGKILGGHFLHITQASQLTGKFNNHLKDALLVFADEAFWAGDKQSEGVLKGMITEDTLSIEPKGKDAFSVKNHVRLLIASNNDWLVPAGLQERRFCVLDVGDKHQQDHAYFDAIWKEMKNGGREALLYELLEADISEVDFYDFPKTEALLDQKLTSMTSVEKFWFSCLNRGSILPPKNDQTLITWEDFVSTHEFYDVYWKYCQIIGDRYPVIDAQFIKRIKELCPEMKAAKPREGQKRVCGYRLPLLEECRQAFETCVKDKIKWDFDRIEMEKGGQ